MSPSRRDILKLAAGLGLAGAVPTMADRIAAAEILNQHTGAGDLMSDPATFAREVGMGTKEHMDNWFDGAWWAIIAPEENAAERKALAAFEREWPGIANGGRNAFWEYQEAVFYLAISMYEVGLRHGGAYENLRREVAQEIRGCTMCWGTGVTQENPECPQCGGTGVVRHRA